MPKMPSEQLYTSTQISREGRHDPNTSNRRDAALSLFAHGCQAIIHCLTFRYVPLAVLRVSVNKVSGIR